MKDFQLQQFLQEAFYIPVLYTLFCLKILPTIEDIPSPDRAEPCLCLPAFILVNQMAILPCNSFLAVLDLKDLTAEMCIRDSCGSILWAGFLLAKKRGILFFPLSGYQS